jgi:peroxiredoxin Q/BCP
VGISLDSVADQKKFHTAQELNFPLLSDPDASAAAKYGALLEGRPYTRRVSFVIDPKGVLRAIDEEVQVSSHGNDVIDLVDSLRK